MDRSKFVFLVPPRFFCKCLVLCEPSNCTHVVPGSGCVGVLLVQYVKC